MMLSPTQLAVCLTRQSGYRLINSTVGAAGEWQGRCDFGFCRSADAEFWRDAYKVTKYPSIRRQSPTSLRVYYSMPSAGETL